MNTQRHIFRAALMLCAIAFFSTSGQAQTSSFSYQGRFTDATVAQPTNGSYQMQFALFDAGASGTQIGSTITNPSVLVANGVFTVQLDFGASGFNGAARFLEISVFSPATSAFINLTPRQPLTSAPYAIRSQSAAVADNATQLGGVAASQYVQNTDTRLADARTPTAGSTNYVQNTTTPQAASNFNISGDGTAGGTLSGNVVNAATQFNLNGSRFLSNAGIGNLFAGRGAGAANPTGSNNAFFGADAGRANTSGGNNAFVGASAGFFNTSGNNNAFVGIIAGFANTTGAFNTFIGRQAGGNVTTGSGNVFIGNDTGLGNLTGNSNTAIGSGANVDGNLAFATAIGSLAVVATDNTIVLGRSADTVQIPGLINAATQYNLGGYRVLAVSGAGNANTFAGVGAGANTTPSNNIGNFNSFFGAGAGQANTTGLGNSFIGQQAGTANTTGSSNTFIGSGAGSFNRTGSNNTLLGGGATSGDGLSYATAIGGNAAVVSSNTIALGRINGEDRVLAPGGITSGSITANGPISTSRQISATGGLILNDSRILLRDSNDPHHAISYDQNIDGIRFDAFNEFQWVRSSNNSELMHLFGNGVLRASGFNGRCVAVFAGNGVCNQDLAETFRTKEQTEAGDVVTLIPEDNERPTVRRSLRAYDEHLIGVVSTNPGLVFDEGDTKLAGANDHYITKEKTVVAAVGRVPVKFTLENGAINVGDALTSSATEPGKAMKATGAGKIIGIALESSAKAKDGKLLLWLQVGYSAPPQQLDELKALRQQVEEFKAQLAALAAQLTQSKATDHR